MLSTVPNLQAMAAVAYTPATNGFYILEPKAGCKTVSVCVCAALCAKAFSQAPGSKRPLPSFDPWFQRPDGQMQPMNSKSESCVPGRCQGFAAFAAYTSLCLLPALRGSH